ncbi:RNA methyltransferase, TrmH family, group 3 [Gleimia coleocanis DSM 15436]|uniref:RNA methyltransferase, TrmH family, group 3 n=1 Tax=Gleimia coleocanis DSM 15436 TaxID=525245 RepID=C0W229_9ACTO|nr:23S rRNA (guanosine(2251)-2'-O)-methyltransferase RlmB [Gleimia coleocanis]EEH63243.1 RNA methyltransferase, TrmH family, group 3 [Gleimia coleocanis DSM 15436]
MAGNDANRRSVKKKKGPLKGTGGHSRRALKPKGPTPKAEDRVYHAAHKRKVEKEIAEKKKAQAEAHRTRTSIKIAAGNELIVGRNAVFEAVDAGIDIIRVFLAGNALDERIGKVVRTATALGAPVLEVTKMDLENASGESAHQSIGIEVPEYDYCSAQDLLERTKENAQIPLIVALDQVTDPHNLGAVLRSGGAFGITGVLISERRSASVNAAAWKVSAGAAARVPVARETNLVRALGELKEAGCFVVGLDGGGDVSLRDLDLATGPLVVVTGAEGKGLSRLVRETCDQIVSIPISSAVESLNAAVATGIALYEVASKRAEA